MVAVVNVQRMTGAGPVYTNVAAVRLRTDDTNTMDNTNPVPIDPAGVGNFKYSYWCSLCLDLAGAFAQIDNIRHYTDGAIGWTYGTGGEWRRGNRDAGDHGCPDGSYQQATGVISDSGHTIEDAVNGHAYYNAQVVKTADLELDVAGAPPVIDSTAYVAGGKTKHLVMQVKVDGDAVQGAQAAEQGTFIFDEI